MKVLLAFVGRVNKDQRYGMEVIIIIACVQICILGEENYLKDDKIMKMEVN